MTKFEKALMAAVGVIFVLLAVLNPYVYMGDHYWQKMAISYALLGGTGAILMLIAWKITPYPDATLTSARV